MPITVKAACEAERTIMAYDQAKKFSKRPEKFGTGIPEGIVASEASNSANVAGPLMMIMAFGIPGDAVTAVMLGALTVHGIQPGPLFISQDPKVAYGIFASYLVALPLMVVVTWVGSRAWMRVIMMPKSMLIPIVLVLCVIGAYALGNRMNDVYVLGLFCVIGYAMVKARMPLAPLILGVVLGDQIESNMIQAISTADPWLFLTRPISGGLIAASALSIGFAVWGTTAKPGASPPRKKRSAPTSERSDKNAGQSFQAGAARRAGRARRRAQARAGVPGLTLAAVAGRDAGKPRREPPLVGGDVPAVSVVCPGRGFGRT
jgi:TctA family transporter